MQIAGFPSLVMQVTAELASYVSGSYQDEAHIAPRPDSVELSGFKAFSTPNFEVPSLLYKADIKRMKRGWRLIAGFFAIDGQPRNAAVLISPELEIVKRWLLNEAESDGNIPRSQHRKFVHGYDILPDGSLIFTFDGSVSIQKFDACGTRLWATTGSFHHAVSLDDSKQSVWTLSEKGNITRIRADDGAIIQRIYLEDIIAANPEIDILGIRRVHDDDVGGNSRNTVGVWMDDPIHYNDVDPLPAALANKFPGFDAGDLLISARSLNLVFVLDPQTLDIKWWRSGAVQRQHDPDWMPDGWISIFNNRMSGDFSNIVKIHPDSFKTEVLVAGGEHDFYSRIRGKHQILPDNSVLVTSSQQGRAFEVSKTGEMLFEVINTKPGADRTNYVISEMKWLPEDFFVKENWQCKN